MLRTASPLSLSSQHMHTASRPRPLSERSANTCPRYVSPFMSAPQHSLDAQKEIPFAKRNLRKSQFAKDRETANNRRRELFFRNVRQRREDKKWEQRGIPDQIMRADFVKDQRRWEAAKASSAPDFSDFIDEESGDIDDDYPLFSSQDAWAFRTEWPGYTPSSQRPLPSSQLLPSELSLQSEEEAEAMLELERQELDAMTSMIEEQGVGGQENVPLSPQFGSDDDEFDDLLMDLVNAQEQQQNQSMQPTYNQADEDMEMS